MTGKNWIGYNWYQVENISLMMLNVDFPVKIDSVVSLGCHEGYPGHHVWNMLVENRLLKEKGWIEFAVFPLFSPYALIAEGSANYGVHLAFPDNEKSVFEREVLFPLAKLDPENAIILDKLNELTRRLDHALTATAQLYLDGDISRDEAIEQRRKYGLSSQAKAEQSVRFIEQYRSYVVNYNLGQDIVKTYIESQSDDPGSRWDAFERMLTELVSASDIVTSPADVGEISNYRQYSPQFSSSGQPTADQLEAVAEEGFKRVIYLAFSDDSTAIDNEDRVVKKLDMDYVHIPVDFDNPTLEEFEDFPPVMEILVQ